MAKHTLMIASLLAVAPLFAQSPANGMATARVKIISQATWQKMKGFTTLSEVRLTGVVAQVEGGVLHLRMAFGTVRVELGQVVGTQALRAGDVLEVVAAKIMTGGAQRFLATQVIQQS